MIGRALATLPREARARFPPDGAPGLRVPRPRGRRHVAVDASHGFRITRLWTDAAERFWVAPSAEVKEGERVLGYAACVVKDAWTRIQASGPNAPA
jgi:hypothetical protein